MARCEQIHVALRFRPLSLKELESKDQEIWSISQDSVSLKPEFLSLLHEAKRISSSGKVYSYDQCFTSQDTNLQVYRAVVRRVVIASLEGYNGTIFAYGQTGSGKTFTMMGADAHGEAGDPGVVLLALDDLFRAMDSDDKTYCLSCSYQEIYNEQVFDLLAASPGHVLPVCEDPHKGFYVKGLSEHVVSTKEEILKYIAIGEAARRYAATTMNHHSSRSHTIFQLHVTSLTTPPPSAQDNSPDTGSPGREAACDESITTESVLNFVDLAGSERVSSLHEVPSDKRKARGSSETLVQEGKHINTSLFYLCQVISRLADKASEGEHVPYRNSNLTKILRSSLGGNSLTCIICTATPSLSQFEMTLSTLRFGGKAQTITNQVAANFRSEQNAELVVAYQRSIDELRRELEQANCGGRAKAEEAATVRKSLEERIAKLTKMLITKAKTEPVKTSSPKALELWAWTCADLIIDSRLQRHDNWAKYLQPGTAPQQFDSKGLYAFQRLKEASRDRVCLEKEMKDLKKANEQLSVAKSNLKRDLKQSVELCRKLSDRKTRYKQQTAQLQTHAMAVERRLAQLEHFVGFECLTLEQLEELERFFYKGLDASKEARIRKQLSEETGTLVDKSNSSLHDCVTKEDSESSIEFESSFYKGRSRSRLTFDQENTSLSLAQMLDYPDTPHLGELGDFEVVCGGGDLC
jgi:hypothetical protein